MTASRNKVLEKAKSWNEVAPAHQREIIKRLASLGDGYHFAGELGMEACVKLAIRELKQAAAEPEAKDEEPCATCHDVIMLSGVECSKHECDCTCHVGAP